jgi:hypothetical protein
MSLLSKKSAALLVVATGLASPALAQDGLCGGTGANGQWIGGDQAGSDISTAGNYQEQMALVMGGNQYVSLFTLSEGTDIRVEAAGRGAGDTIIDLLDEKGELIVSDDDSGGNGASRAETFLGAGTYCMAVSSYDGGPMTAFVRVGRTEHEPLTDGIQSGGPTSTGGEGSCDTAVPIGGLGSVGTASVDETPYWSFTLDAPTQVSIRAENENADPVLTLYDADSGYIAENDDFDGLNSQIDMSSPLDPGTYCIGITALSDTSLPITVSVTEYDAAAALLDLYLRGEAAPPLDGSVPFTNLGMLESRLRQDVTATSDVSWFTVDVDDGDLLVVEAIANGSSDPWLVVYDDLGRMIGQNDDYGDGLDSLVMGRIQGGTYIIGVKQFDDSQGFVRLVAERYVRAR